MQVVLFLSRKPVYIEDLVGGVEAQRTYISLPYWLADMEKLRGRRFSDNSPLSNSSSFREKGVTYTMTRKKDQHADTNSVPTVPRPTNGTVSRWVNINFSPEDQLALAGFEYDPPAVGAGILARCIGGWDITVKWDTKSSCWNAFGMGYVANHPDEFIGVSARSSDPVDAALALLYKLDLLDERGLPANAANGGRRFS